MKHAIGATIERTRNELLTSRANSRSALKSSNMFDQDQCMVVAKMLKLLIISCGCGTFDVKVKITRRTMIKKSLSSTTNITIPTTEIWRLVVKNEIRMLEVERVIDDPMRQLGTFLVKEKLAASTTVTGTSL